MKEGRARYDTALAERILQDRPDLIVLAGWSELPSESCCEACILTAHQVQYVAQSEIDLRWFRSTYMRSTASSANLSSPLSMLRVSPSSICIPRSLVRHINPHPRCSCHEQDESRANLHFQGCYDGANA